MYFSFYAEYFDPEIVTKTLGIQPTSVKLKKDLVPKSTSWDYRVDAGSNIDLERYLEDLIDTFHPTVEAIVRLKTDLQLSTLITFVIDIDIDPNSSTPYFGLNKRTVSFLGSTETEVEFDVYKADTIRLLDRLNGSNI